MMSNIETVQAMYAAFGTGDVASILEHMADDVAWESWEDNSSQKAGVPLMVARTGREGVAEFFAETANYEYLDFQVLDLLASDRQVAAEIVIEAKHRETGASFRDEEIHLFQFDDEGKIVRLRHYTDTAKHIAAQG